jgi:DNA invertase Pin-like site-specific DNA recombinase
MKTHEQPLHACLDVRRVATALPHASSDTPASLRFDGTRHGSKIGPRHLKRPANVYVRQSSPHQVAEHGESLARQYALRDRAAALGWPAPDIVVIDDDLGLSGRGFDDRRGFERLLADVAQDRVGLVLALEMSRLARNSRDWHNLFDLCAVRDTLLADEDGIYDPSDINDRLILGMKGIISEMELHIMKNRLERGRRNKAERGELFQGVPWGFVLLPDGTVALDPDEQVRATVRRLFDTFQDLGSAFATVRTLRQEDVKLPIRDRGGHLVWRVATPTIVDSALHHPLYAGAYSWGRRQEQTHIDPAGRLTRKRRKRPLTEWTVLLLDRVPAYFSWDQYLANQRQLLENRTRPETKCVARTGSALLAGLLYCGRCGRRMQVQYPTKRQGRYQCSRYRVLATDPICSGLVARNLDELVAQQVLHALSPAALELSLSAIEHASQQRRQQETQLRQNLDRALYESERAERQYNAVEPENRLVARTLEERWESALKGQRAAQDAYDRFGAEKPIDLTAAERRSIDDLSRDIPALWHAPETDARARKEIVRCLIERVDVDVSQADQQVDVAIQWAGGFESRHQLRRSVNTYKRLDNAENLLARIGELRRAGWRSPRIAEQLNSEGFERPKRSGPFTADDVRGLFPRVPSGAKRQSGVGLQPPLWSADSLARRLEIPVKKIKDWVRRGWVHAFERPFDGVWILEAHERDLKRLEQMVAMCRPGCHYPPELTSPGESGPQNTDNPA